MARHCNGRTLDPDRVHLLYSCIQARLGSSAVLLCSTCSHLPPCCPESSREMDQGLKYWPGTLLEGSTMRSFLLLHCSSPCWSEPLPEHHRIGMRHSSPCSRRARTRFFRVRRRMFRESNLHTPSSHCCCQMFPSGNQRTSKLLRCWQMFQDRSQHMQFDPVKPGAFHADIPGMLFLPHCFETFPLRM